MRRRDLLGSALDTAVEIVGEFQKRHGRGPTQDERALGVTLFIQSLEQPASEQPKAVTPVPDKPPPPPGDPRCPECGGAVFDNRAENALARENGTLEDWKKDWGCKNYKGEGACKWKGDKPA